MAGPRQRRCQFCGTAPADDGRICWSCARVAGFRHPIPEGFYEALPDMREALGRYDFGTVFGAVRQHTGLSQLQLGDLLGLSQSRVSAVERGERRLTHVRFAARMAEVLRIPPRLLGFPEERVDTVAPHMEVSWLERRDFLALVTAATLGSSLHPDLARLGSLLPGAVEPVTRKRIGAADVAAIEAITDGFRRSDYAHGGGLCRAAATAHLHQVRRLEEAVCTSEVRTRLLVSIAELAGVAGWMAYDVEDHDAARRLWTFALHTARQADDHPRAADRAVDVLLDMAHQALHLYGLDPSVHADRAGEALQLVQLAAATAANRRHPVSTTTQGYISAVLAWCRAALGEAEPAQRAIGNARALYAAADPAAAPPWAQFVTNAEEHAQQGHALYLLSLSRPDFATQAVEHLSRAAAGYGEEYQRSRAMILPSLASAQFLAGDTTAAIRTGYDAVDVIVGLSSTRGHARLRALDAVATPHAARQEVADLREHLRDTVMGNVA